MPERQPANREHLICAVDETSPLWSRYVLTVQPHGEDGQWVIAHRSTGLFWDRHHTWTPDIRNAARFPEDKARQVADRLAVSLVTEGITAAETLRS
ncbi:hypothetical protein [Micromonospora sp. WMMD737]|uniref:hypothetical protein n=1 Tax=Micromonospora sp. WMMD737 TaxID=3404113 RepID=UPI003B92A69F